MQTLLSIARFVSKEKELAMQSIFSLGNEKTLRAVLQRWMLGVCHRVWHVWHGKGKDQVT